MGKTAAGEAGKILRFYTAEKGLEVMTIFAAAPSQDTFLAQLCQEEGINWKKVIAFYLDYNSADKLNYQPTPLP